MTHFYDVAEEAGYQMDVASPLGGKVPIDPESLAQAVLAMGGTIERYKDRTFMDRLDQALKIADVDASKYDAIYLTGGHGVMFDFPDSPELQKLVADFHQAGKVVSAVCHGPAGLLNVKLADGSPLLDGKNVTGFSWNEETKVDRADAVPFNLEEELQSRGASYTKAWLAMGNHVVTDGRLITGQNPTSARGVAQAVVKKLQEG
nr:type 1 glutamine amidotransferase domain-containing protein [Paludisphaera mucosa]